MDIAPCSHTPAAQSPRFVVVTGGPGAGKTAVLELARRVLCSHVAVLPEAAGIVYGGGFPRRADGPARRAAQRSIFHVQVELERMTREEAPHDVVLCDRGTVDGLAYWPDAPAEYWRDLGTTHAAELARYAAVIHLAVPPAPRYRKNGLRIESAEEAARIDERIGWAWREHPRVLHVASTDEFLTKASHVIARMRAELPACCRDGCALGAA